MTTEPCAKFWMVWRAGSVSTAYQHFTKEAAETEAKRLAQQCPGQVFFVLAAVGAFSATVNPVSRLKVERRADPDFEIPF
jgi:hypothetical protein